MIGIWKQQSNSLIINKEENEKFQLFFEMVLRNY